MHNVEVDVLLPQEAALEGRATVKVLVEDVSQADAPAKVVAEQRLEGVELAGGKALHLTVPVSEQRVEPRARYNVRVQIKRGEGEWLDAGDLVSTQSHPVLTWGAPTQVTVPVRSVS
jgi:uncharacterized lipoprotein YbaY